MIVDEEEGVLEILSYYITDLGFDVDQACDGEMALMKVKETQYDLIITDITMPKLNGDQLLYQIKENQLQKNAKCIYITGGLLEYTEKQFKELNDCSDASIFKPFVKEQIHQVIKTVYSK